MHTATENIFRINTKNPEAVISIVDESLEMKNELHCDLYSTVSANEFSLALLDRKQNKFLALEVFQNKETNGSTKQIEWLKEISGKSILLKKYKLKSATVAIVNELTTLVPSALFRKEDAEKYFHFNFHGVDAVILSENIRAYDSVNIFGLPEKINETLNQIFDQPAIHHHSTALLEGVHLSFKKTNEKTLLLNIRNRYVEIVVTEGKKLIFINAFQYSTIDDLIYYVMFACDRLQLNPENVLTSVMGEVERESDVYKLLYKYIRNLNFAMRPTVFDFSYAFKEIPAHYYFNLFSLALCES